MRRTNTREVRLRVTDKQTDPPSLRMRTEGNNTQPTIFCSDLPGLQCDVVKCDHPPALLPCGTTAASGRGRWAHLQVQEQSSRQCLAARPPATGQPLLIRALMVRGREALIVGSTFHLQDSGCLATGNIPQPTGAVFSSRH